MLRFVPTFVGLFALGQMIMLYQYDPDAYFGILRFIGIDPWPHPFIDSAYMYAMKDCWLRGIDVYQGVPCDRDGVPITKMAYSPLWQRLWFLPTTDAARYQTGLITDALLLISLTILPPARTKKGATVMSLAVCSTMVCFALERNNIDVWIYLLVIVGGSILAHGGRLRAAAYVIYIVAGLLKYYPLSLFGLALRERPARFALIASLSIAATLLFAAAFWSEIQQEFKNIPKGSPFGDLVGITNIPIAFSLVASRFLGANMHLAAALSLFIRIFLTGLVFAAAIITVRRPGLRNVLQAMPEPERLWLLTGCLLVGFCYLAGQNVGYRGIYLLIVLSGLLALRHVSEDRTIQADMDFVTMTVVVMMWTQGIRLGLKSLLKAVGAPDGLGNGVQVAIWLARECLWLNLERILLAILISFAVTSVMGSRLSLPEWIIPPQPT